jgi:hypothetical protein
MRALKTLPPHPTQDIDDTILKSWHQELFSKNPQLQKGFLLRQTNRLVIALNVELVIALNVKLVIALNVELVITVIRTIPI